MNDLFSRDKKSIFHEANKLPRVDVETWEYLTEGYSKDKNKVYNMNLEEN